MKRNTRKGWIGLLSLGLIAVATIVVVLTVFAGTNDDRFTATGYSDLIRFQAEGVATLQVQVFDLSGRTVWDSGVVSGDTIDWDRRNDTGERLAYGAYIYSAQGWNASGDLNFQKNGKLALMPGDQVQLQAAPVVQGTADTSSQAPTTQEEPSYAPMAYDHTGDLTISGKLGVGTDNPGYPLHIESYQNYGIQLEFSGTAIGRANLKHPYNIGFRLEKQAGYQDAVAFSFAVYEYLAEGTNLFTVWNDTLGKGAIVIEGSTNNFGVGTLSPTAKLTVEATSGDLIAAYNSSNRVFVVKNSGEVRADGTVYAAGFNTGSADVAERINTSEWVEPGNVVEIDPEHPGFFRKASSPYSTKVAGIISTSPGVILGNNFDEATDDWEDKRPVLAVTGRVPCKVSAENGPIQIGNLLVASSTLGVAMRGSDRSACLGATIGKAMEPLEGGTGVIMVQVILR